MLTFSIPTDGADFQGRSLDSDLHFLATDPLDRFVEVLSLVLAAREDLRDGE